MESTAAPPETRSCKHFVTRKKRHCRMLVKPGEQFCGEHQPFKPADGSNLSKEGNIRIPCPLDPKHTCYAHNLAKHLKICNARPGESLPYIEKGVNLGGQIESSDSVSKLLSSFPVEEIVGVVSKVNAIFEDLVKGKIGEKFARHEVVEVEMLKPEYGDKTKKHLKQASSILGLLGEYGLMRPSTCYIEFGAGRGQLSYWLAKATESCPDSSFLLIERSSPKHKRDNKLDKTEDKVQRIRADIADLVLDRLEAIRKTRGIVGVTKHLCGDATDLAMRCLANVRDNADKVEGCIMTFCCHHRCRWLSYTGKEFFESVGLTQNDFDMMCGMSSWATCGSGFNRERNLSGEALEDAAQSQRDKEIGLSRDEKEEVGRRCKNIVNFGRLRYLEGLGFCCGLHYYVPQDVSLENVCIVAYNKKKKP